VPNDKVLPLNKNMTLELSRKGLNGAEKRKNILSRPWEFMMKNSDFLSYKNELWIELKLCQKYQ